MRTQIALAALVAFAAAEHEDDIYDLGFYTLEEGDLETQGSGQGERRDLRPVRGGGGNTPSAARQGAARAPQHSLHVDGRT